MYISGGEKEILEIAICNPLFCYFQSHSLIFFWILLLNVIKGLKIYALQLN